MSNQSVDFLGANSERLRVLVLGVQTAWTRDRDELTVRNWSCFQDHPQTNVPRPCLAPGGLVTANLEDSDG